MPAWSCEHTLTTQTPPGAIWQRLADVARWPEWDDEVLHAELDGPLVVGATGRLRPRGGPATRFALTELEPERRLTDRSRLPLARMEFDHRLRPTRDGGTQLTHRITIDGPLGSLFGRILGARLRAGLPVAMDRLVELAGPRVA